MNRHHVFRWTDGRYYITETGWKQTPPDYKSTSNDVRMVLVYENGTVLAPVTVIPDDAFVGDIAS